jgi:kynurenine formamidase
MIAKFDIDGTIYKVDFTKPHSIAIPLDFNGQQPNTYGVPKATSKAYADENFVGDVRQGGSCNFETIQMTPHCNGTHTECLGHITKDRVHIAETNNKKISTALLISIEPTTASDTTESYNHTLNESDRLITKSAIESQIAKHAVTNFDSLIIRTEPNTSSKLSDNYSELPAYFSHEAMQYIFELGVSNLLVDVPSIDRLYDAGIMDNHRTFWQVNEQRQLNQGTSHKTVTEFVYADNSLSDGLYLLDIQIPPFLSDAAPSTPILYYLEKQ